MRAGMQEALATLREAAALSRRQGLPQQLAEAALGLAHRNLDASRTDAEAVALLEASSAALGASDSPLKVRVLARLANVLHFQHEPARTDELSTTALAGARRLGDPATLAVALESRQNALLDVAHLDERLALSEELLALARSVGDAELEALALHRRVYNLLEAGRTGDALAARTQLERVADDLRQPLFQHWATCWMAVWAQLAGDFDAASELAARALALGRRAPSGNPRNTTYPGQLLAIAYWRDELGPSAAVIAGHVERNPHLSIYRAALGLAYLQAGERDRAVTEFESQAADGFRGIAHDMNWFTAVCLLAELCARIGDTERASLLYALLAPHRHKVAVVTSIGCWGPAERYLGLLAATRGDSERAVEHFEAALARAASCGMLHPLARMREEYARAARPVNPVVRPRTRR
jgi:tetratricopeptide (TPR) repeat protein